MTGNRRGAKTSRLFYAGQAMNLSLNLLTPQMEAGLVRGGIVLAGRSDRLLYHEVAGMQDFSRSVPMRPDALFDVASISKAVGIATLVMLSRQQGRLELDAPFVDYLPDYAINLANPPTIRQMLAHNSGFDNSKPYQQLIASGGGEPMLKAALQTPPANPPGQQVVYSCLNYILLGLLLEHQFGTSLEEIAGDWLFTPLAMRDTTWGCPRMGDLNRTAVMEICSATVQVPARFLTPGLRFFRDQGKLPCDETARAAMPHRLGHAGLFTSADDLATYGRMLLSGGQRLLDAVSLHEMGRCCTPPGQPPRSPGWDKAPFAGLSAAAVHHTGWTGQSLVIDPEQDLFVVMLTVRCGDWGEAAARRRAAIEHLLAVLATG